MPGVIAVPFPAGRRPGQLTHYTTRAGLIGILESGEIWATDIRFLNDSAESEHARKLGSELVNKRLAAETDPRTRAILDDIAMFVRSFTSVPEAFVFSMSAVGDDLGQWRAYGSGSSGYGLSLGSRLLATSFRGYAILVRCAYRPHEQHRVVRQVIDSAIASDAGDAERRDDTTRLVTGIAFSALLAAIAPSIKHPAFAAEKEWRLIVLPRADTPYVRDVRETPNGLAPFVRIPVRDLLLGALKRIVIGPMRDQAREKVAVDALLRKHGLAATKTELSKIPFRTW